MDVMIGGRKWNALQALFDARKDCTGRMDMREAIVLDSAIYCNPNPIYLDDLTGEYYVPLSAVLSAFRLYADISDGEALSI